MPACHRGRHDELLFAQERTSAAEDERDPIDELEVFEARPPPPAPPRESSGMPFTLLPTLSHTCHALLAFQQFSGRLWLARSTSATSRTPNTLTALSS